MDLITPVILELQRRLEENLPARIDAINLQNPDGTDFAIGYPSAVLPYAPPISEVVEVPLLAIIDGQTDFVADRGSEAEADHDVTIACYMQDSDPRALAWKLRRYSRAITETVLAGRTGNPAFWGIQLRAITPGPALGNRNNPGLVLSWTSVTVRASTDES